MITEAMFKDCLNLRGIKAQMLKTIEEMSELTKELAKKLNNQTDNIEQIIEETIHVDVMIQQIKYWIKSSLEMSVDYNDEELSNDNRIANQIKSLKTCNNCINADDGVCTFAGEVSGDFSCEQFEWRAK
jgi:septal ring factor EnvC (AmiA/AmiB activator)